MVEIETIGEITERDLLDAMVEEAGHVAPPDDYITVDAYMDAVARKGGNVCRNTALEVLLARVEKGELEGCKMNVGGRQRWVFWPTNHRDRAESSG